MATFEVQYAIKRYESADVEADSPQDAYAHIAAELQDACIGSEEGWEILHVFDDEGQDHLQHHLDVQIS